MGGPPRRTARLLLFAAAALAAAVPLAVLALRAGDEPSRPATVDLDGCRGLLREAARDCLVGRFGAVVGGADDPRPAVAAIELAVRREGGAVLSDCHGVMHTVGRVYALDEGLALADLRERLPRSNDPGCSAGFAHGLVSGLAERIDPARPAEAAGVCADAPTRYQRYSCVHGLGHAFMRLYAERLEPALELCGAIGRDAPDCAQGAFHDYWFAVVGADGVRLEEAAVRDPRRLCAGRESRFVRPCWYRAYVDEPPPVDVDSPEHLQVLCDGLRGLQRSGCVTAAAVIGPADPAAQLAICAQLEDAADAESCVRGTKLQNLLGRPVAELAAVVARCADVRAAVAACYRWLGTVATVVTDGAFAREGCQALPGPAARRACEAGARASEGPLETFS